MRTHVPTTRVNRRNPHLARLDRQIRLRGEDLELTFQVGSTTITRNRINLRGVVKTLGIAQLLGGVTQTNYVVLISPNDLRASKFKSGTKIGTVTGGGVSAGHMTATDITLPLAGAGNNLFFRGTSKQISRVDAIYQKNECVRVEVYVTG